MTSLFSGSDEFERALLNPPEPNDKLRELMRDAVTLWDDAVREPIPQKWFDMLARLK
jgi:hypothetical protein